MPSQAGRDAPPGEDSHTGSAFHVARDSRMNYAQVTDWHTRLLNVTGMSST